MAMLTAHVNEIGIVLRGFDQQRTPAWWESLLDALRAHHVPSLNPTGKRTTLDAGAQGGLRAIVYFTPNTVSLDESIPILRKHGIQVYDVRGEEPSMKFVKGDYVRMLAAPDTRMGTIEGYKIERGITQFHFRQDPRLKEVGPSVEIWVFEDEVEACAKPTDAYWKTVNELIKRGS